MNIWTAIFRSTLGRKYLMAITGIGLFLYVVLHLLGNLQIFAGKEALNSYGAMLKANAGLLWTARLILFGLVAVHIGAAISLVLENRAARPERYKNRKVVAATYASRTMIWSGVIIAAFVIYHLLHFTVGVTHPEHYQLHDTKGRHDVFAMVVLGFSNFWVSAWYILSMGFLCFHLHHGVAAMFQSLGFKNAKYGACIDWFAAIAAWAIFFGYISIPISILLGYGR